MSDETDQIVNAIKETLVEHDNPKHLFLFGSKANGTAKSTSDYDFSMVLDYSKRAKVDLMSDAISLIWDKHQVTADVFIFTEKEFERPQSEFSSISETAVAGGRGLPL